MDGDIVMDDDEIKCNWDCMEYIDSKYIYQTTINTLSYHISYIILSNQQTHALKPTEYDQVGEKS